jgi:hypothetical protein
MAKLRSGNRASTGIGGGDSKNTRFFLPSANVNYITPDWDKSNVPTIVKIVPTVQYDDDGKKVFAPYRTDVGTEGLTDWFISLPVAKYVGINDKQNFVLFDPLEAIEGNYDANTNPYVMMYNTVKRLTKHTQPLVTDFRTVHPRELIAFFPNETSRDSVAFSRPSERMVFMNVVPLINRDKVQVTDQRTLSGLTKGETPIVMGMSKSAAKILLEMVNTDVDGKYPHGDITHNQTGKWAVIYHAGRFGHEDFTKPSAGVRDKANQEASFDAPADGGNSRISYGVALSPEVWGPTVSNQRASAKYSYASVMVGKEAAMLHNYQPLAEYFHVPTHDEIVRYLALAFKPEPYLLQLGLDDSGYLTDEIWGLLRNRVQTSVPAEPPKASRGASATTQQQSRTQKPTTKQVEQDVFSDPVYDDASGTLFGDDSLETDDLPSGDEVSTDLGDLDVDIDELTAELGQELNAEPPKKSSTTGKPSAQQKAPPAKPAGGNKRMQGLFDEDDGLENPDSDLPF